MVLHRKIFRPQVSELFLINKKKKEAKKRMLKALNNLFRINYLRASLKKNQAVLKGKKKLTLSNNNCFKNLGDLPRRFKQPNPPFDMLKPVIPSKKTKKEVYLTFDIESISLKVSSIPEHYYKLIFDAERGDKNINEFFKHGQIYTFDETKNIQLPIAVGISRACSIHNIKEGEVPELETTIFQANLEKCDIEHIIEESFRIMEDFFIYIKKLSDTIYSNYDNIYLYAHNAGGYDGYIFYYNYLKLDAYKIFNKKISSRKKDNRFLNINIGKKIQIRDSLQLLNGGLNNLGKALLNEEKEEMPVKRFTIENLISSTEKLVSPEKLQSYLKQDCELLFKCLVVFNQYLNKFFKTNFYEKLTMSSLTVHIFFKNYYNPILDIEWEKWENGIFTLNTEQEEAIRSAFHGGRTEFYKPSIKKGRCWDINAAYVAAMMYRKMPVGKPQGPYPVEDGIGFFHHNLDKFFGFAEAKIYTPPSLTEHGYLPHTLPSGMLGFPKGSFEGWFFSEELKLAKSLGYLIIIKKIITFDKDRNLFTDYLKLLNDLRKQFPKGHPYNILSKFLGNGLYGRFAMNLQPQKYFLVYSDREVRKICENHLIKQYFLINSRKGKEYYSMEALKDENNKSVDSFSVQFKVGHTQRRVAPQISAAVAAYTRMNLAEILSKDFDKKIAYVDTDSIFVEGDFTPENVDPNKPGAWKIEAEFEEAMFFGQKFYILKQKGKNSGLIENKLKIRGVPNCYKEEIDESELKKFQSNQDVQIEIPGDIDSNRITLQGDKLNFLMLEKPKSLTLRSSTVDGQCIRVFDSEGNWIGVRPFVLVNGGFSTLAKYLPEFVKAKQLFNEHLETISYSEYSKNWKKCLEFIKTDSEFAQYAENPKNMPTSSLVDEKTGKFRAKTESEFRQSLELDLHKYEILLDFKAFDPDKTKTVNKALRLYLQLEQMLESFKIKNKCSDEEVLNKLKEKRIIQATKYKEGSSLLTSSFYSDKSLLYRVKTELLNEIKNS